MKVQMLVDTGIMNGYAHVGDLLDVEDAVAERWVDHKIAVFVNAEPDELTNAAVDELPTSEVVEEKKPVAPKEKKVMKSKKGA